MTTTVTKGAGRKTATDRRDRAAQRTPLPGDALSPSASADADAAKMTVVALRKLAAGLGVKGAGRMNREALMVTLASHAEAAERTSGATPTEDTPTPTLPTEEAPTQANPPAQGGSRSTPKAEAFADLARPNGWTVEIATGAGDWCCLTAQRGGDAIRLVWNRGVYDYQASRYTTATRTTRPRNVSAARGFAVQSSA